MRKLLWAKTKKGAIIPTKRDEDAGYDIYPCFEEDYIRIKPHKTVMIPTGIASAFDDDYVMILKERGSTGTKGIAQRAGVIDAGFRGEWQIPITNTTKKTIYISDWRLDMLADEYYNIEKNGVVYPKSKAICQAVMLEIPKVKSEEIGYEELKEIKSKRGEGMLGSSGK